MTTPVFATFLRCYRVFLCAHVLPSPFMEKRISVVCNVLLEAVRSGDVEGVKRVLLRPDLPTPPQGEESWGHVTLSLAVSYDQVEVARYLVFDLKVDVNYEHENNMTPLDVAFDCDQEAMALFLIREAKINVGTGNSGAQHHAHVAAVKGMTDVVRCLVRERGVDAKAKDDHERDLVYYAALGGHVAVMKFVVEELGLGVGDLYDHRKLTLLHVAADSGHMELVRWLVEVAHVDVQATDASGLSPKDYAAVSGHEGVAQYLDEQWRQQEEQRLMKNAARNRRRVEKKRRSKLRRESTEELGEGVRPRLSYMTSNNSTMEPSYLGSSASYLGPSYVGSEYSQLEPSYLGSEYSRLSVLEDEVSWSTKCG